MNSDDTPLLLFGDQLGPHFRAGHEQRGIVLVESAAALRRRPYHRQKLHLVLSGLRHAAAELGDRAVLLRADTYRRALHEFGRPVLVHEPGSHAAERLVERMRADGLVAEVLPTPAFALSRKEFGEWARDRDRFLMEDFYRDQRRRFGILLDGGDPAGGRWNFDADNRESPPKGTARLDVAEPWWPDEDDIDAEVRRDLDRWSLPTVGKDGPRRFAVTRDEAVRAARHFVDERLGLFGPFEDAVLTRDWTMAHSLLSVPLNHGLLHPLEVVRAAERAYRDKGLPLSGVEGFVRQVLGWREYVWHLYWHFGPDYLRHNVFDATAELPVWWTGLRPGHVRAACVRTALESVRDRSWVHHIQRLMVLGNHALQREYDPRALNDWFATAFVDGTPWVMPVNVIGMSQHADGGLIATKPYLSGGAYLNRMTDHCRDCWFDPKRRRGERACPFTAGYWAWLSRHEEPMSRNHRMARAVQSLRRLDDAPEVAAQEAERQQF
ncbi:cryptochrome/photolyase family protein [Kutzneria buriramensis]|uniref:Deoxyribodipyrimidine photolyase-related protein n=1 Tax=Kutzneria buriramensis TaxID=1045776 RepID=A0A3E0H0F1_9PSEU|nr:cryptochrome/photolyase family protein [Kutzneria buriramensis]REH34900.1 deoxyribodipyrimidine photolyase-related protein [Kutzneria buriramensis]